MSLSSFSHLLTHRDLTRTEKISKIKPRNAILSQTASQCRDFLSIERLLWACIDWLIHSLDHLSDNVQTHTHTHTHTVLCSCMSSDCLACPLWGCKLFFLSKLLLNFISFTFHSLCRRIDHTVFQCVCARHFFMFACVYEWLTCILTRHVHWKCDPVRLMVFSAWRIFSSSFQEDAILLSQTV